MQIYGRRWLWRQVPLGEQNGGGRGFRGDLATIRRRWVVGYGRAAGSASADSVVRCQDWVVGGSWGGEPGPAAAAGFAERLLEVIASGRRTATYKLALLMVLLDLCARRGGPDGRAPSVPR